MIASRAKRTSASKRHSVGDAYAIAGIAPLAESARSATYRKSRPGPVGVEVTERILGCNPGRMA